MPVVGFLNSESPDLFAYLVRAFGQGLSQSGYVEGGSPMIDRKRREFITLLGGAAAWPLTARAQQPIKKIRYLGLLLPGPPEASMGKATRDRLRGLGYTEGRDILLEARWADGKMEPLDELAVELARLELDAIIAYTTPGALAARKATTTIPIVFLFVGDPVGTGVVPSLARPGGNATGISLLATELAAKRLEILLEIAPKTSHVAMPTETGLSLFGVLKRADPALVDPGVTAQLECLLDDVVVGKQEMVGAIDAVCDVAQRIIGKLKDGGAAGGQRTRAQESRFRNPGEA